MRRTELKKFSYDLARTRIEMPETKNQWEVTTIDLKQFNQSFPKDALIKPDVRSRSSIPLFATMVYQLDGLSGRRAVHADEDSGKENQLFFHQAYETPEEAQFGHEELVQSILTGQFFFLGGPWSEEDISEYLLYPEIGEANVAEPFHFLPFGIFDVEDSDADEELD